MPFDLSNRLVIGIASSALFNLAASDEVYRTQGTDAYRRHQEAHLDEPLPAGVAFPFIRRLLSLNDLASPDDPLVEVMVLSRNSPDTGLRVMRSIQAHQLPIIRAVFTEGRSPTAYMPALNMSLFLSANDHDVREAIAAGLPAGKVLDSDFEDDPSDNQLRIAFDFDGVLADDSSEQVYVGGGLPAFLTHETANLATAHDPGPLRDFLVHIHAIQRREIEQREQDPSYQPRVRVSLVTARGAPAHERALASLKSWGVTVNDAFFLGGVSKNAITSVLRPHIFFDDQQRHLDATSAATPSVHVPFGVANLGAG